MNQQVVWWISSILTILLTVEKIHSWITVRKRERKFVEVEHDPRSGNKYVRVSSFSIKFDKKRDCCYIPKYGTIALTKDELRQAQRAKKGFLCQSISLMASAEDNYVILSEWSL